MKKISVWKATSDETYFQPLGNDTSVDFAIVGGGITGLTAAELLSKHGHSVAVLEAGKIGEGTTGGSTGNLYAPVSYRLSGILEQYDEKTLKSVVESRLEAIQFIETNILKYTIPCSFVRAPWHLFTGTDERHETIEKEYNAAQKAGLKVSYTDKLSVPMQVHSGIVVEDQAQFNPLEYVKSLAQNLNTGHCSIYENTRVTEVKNEKDGRVMLSTFAHTITAKKVILATHTPIGFYPVQTVVYPYREDGIAAKLNGGEYPPPGIFWELSKGHHHSFRLYDSGKDKYLVVVGEPYKVGQSDDTEGGFDRLEKYARQNFDIKSIEYTWASQSYRSADGLPFIGKIDDNIYTGTGFGTDGLVYGTLAAMIIADQVIGKENSRSKLYDPGRSHIVESVKNFISENLNAAGELAKDLIGTHKDISLNDLKPGEGKVVEYNSKKIAVYKDDMEKIHAVSAVCTHLGCIVHWNNAEKTWDCPCHGSRFKINGHVIEGPALNPLAEEEL